MRRELILASKLSVAGVLGLPLVLIWCGVWGIARYGCGFPVPPDGVTLLNGLHLMILSGVLIYCVQVAVRCDVPKRVGVVVIAGLILVYFFGIAPGLILRSGLAAGVALLSLLWLCGAFLTREF